MDDLDQDSTSLDDLIEDSSNTTRSARQVLVQDVEPSPDNYYRELLATSITDLTG